MENELLSIGRLAALSGLTVSALRFYDGAQVLTPAAVDPYSGYRYYCPDQVPAARLVAHLRRISLPLDDIRLVLAEPDQAGRVLAAQLARLEAGLADVRREISTITRLLENPEITMIRCTVPATELRAALADVRFAVSTDPELPMLNGVFFESTGDRIRLIATDRFRLATSVIANPAQVELAVLVPTEVVDQVLDAAIDGDITVTIDDQLRFNGTGIDVAVAVPEVEFPAYRPQPAGVSVPFDAAGLRSALAGAATEIRQHAGVDYQLSRISVSAGGVRAGETTDPSATVIGVNREFLLQALAAGDQLSLQLDGPIAPLAIRNPDRDEVFSILMPVRLDQQA